MQRGTVWKTAKKTLLKKWTELPKEFIPNYSLPEQSELGRALSELIERRNAIVHAKPMISIDGDNRHTGNEPSFVFNEHAFIQRSASLPFRLVGHLLEFDSDAFRELSNIRTCCGAVANEFDGAQRRLAVVSKIPKGLISEIMQQGNSRRTAVEIAILIGDKPKTDEAGNIVVRRLGKEIARLKPLKFFDSK